MNRIEDIRARIIQKSAKDTMGKGNELRIPGMSIGTRIAPGGPTFEDIVWLTEKLGQAVKILKGSSDENARKLADEIETEHAT